MKTNIQIFKNEVFGEIRTCQVNNQIMFVGKDVAMALGYSNVRDALSKHVDSEDKGVAKCDTLGGAQKITLINSSFAKYTRSNFVRFDSSKNQL